MEDSGRPRRGVGWWCAIALALAACRPSSPDPSRSRASADEALRAALTGPAPSAPPADRAGAPSSPDDTLREAMLGHDSHSVDLATAPPTLAWRSTALSAPWLARFPTGSARLRARDAARIASAARAIRRLPGVVEVEVHGHADATGAAARNDALSRQRAEAVVAALRRNGVGRARLRAVAHGSGEPLVADTPRDRWQNRRVNLTVPACELLGC